MKNLLILFIIVFLLKANNIFSNESYYDYKIKEYVFEINSSKHKMHIDDINKFKLNDQLKNDVFEETQEIHIHGLERKFKNQDSTEIQGQFEPDRSKLKWHNINKELMNFISRCKNLKKITFVGCVLPDTIYNFSIFDKLYDIEIEDCELINSVSKFKLNPNILNVSFKNIRNLKINDIPKIENFNFINELSILDSNNNNNILDSNFFPTNLKNLQIISNKIRLIKRGIDNCDSLETLILRTENLEDFEGDFNNFKNLKLWLIQSNEFPSKSRIRKEINKILKNK
jgi:hypothetical protein